ncbi:MAG: hypothetical protein OYH76_01570 [Defluviicoccus sp.]|nr:hypothetical protein [Defluviicoccus sp.]MDE0274553.1 hypothetical protein [Defluviicoccus sp.]
MAIYYQHIGERLAERDFPRTLGTLPAAMHEFLLADIETYLDHLDIAELEDIRSKHNHLSPRGFQIWGLPSGAERVLSEMCTGDYLMLLESIDFRYCGKVIHRVTEFCWELSRHLWGEQRFPIIVFLQGKFIQYDWLEFVADFQFNQKYHMRGNTMKLAQSRIEQSKYMTENAFISHIWNTKEFRPFLLSD